MMPLKTTRTHLRKFDINDLETFYEYRNDKRCQEYQSWKDNSYECLKQLILNQDSTQIEIEGKLLAIASNETNKLMGHLFIGMRDKTFTLGYTLHPHYWGQGYMSEIIRGLTKKLSDDYPNYEICALVNPQNTRSIHLLEKVGFTFEVHYSQINSSVYLFRNVSK